MGGGSGCLNLCVEGVVEGGGVVVTRGRFSLRSCANVRGVVTHYATGSSSLLLLLCLVVFIPDIHI